MEEERGSEIVRLDSDQFRLFEFLRTRSHDVENAPTVGEIKKHLKISSDSVVKRIIGSLKKVEGIDLFAQSEKKGNEREVRYSLSPETLELSVQKMRTREEFEEAQKREVTYGALYLSEPGFGTKAFDHEKVMKGLRIALEANGLNKVIQQVVIQGGVIPHVPPYASKSYLTALNFLGHVKRKPGEPKTYSEVMLDNKVRSMESSYLEDFYAKHVNNSGRRKIRDLTDAFGVAEEQVSTLMGAFGDDTVLRIQQGEQDRKNMDHIKDTIIAGWSKEKKAKIKEDKEEINAKRIQLYVESMLEGVEAELYQHREVLTKNPSESKVDYQKRLDGEFKKGFAVRSADIPPEFEMEEEDLGSLVNTSARRFYTSLGRVADDSAKLVKKMDERSKRISQRGVEIQKEQEGLEGKLKDIENSISWVERLLETRRESITWFTRQYPVQSDEAEVAWNIAKNLYTHKFYEWNIPQAKNLHVHVSSRKLVSVDTGIVDIGTGENIKTEVEMEEAKYGEKKILLIHNIRTIYSDAVTPRAIRDAKMESNFRNTVLHKLRENMGVDNRPDIILLGGHNGGGFRAMPWFKDSETLGEHEVQFTEGQKVLYMINLPTMQSVERLEWLVSHNFSNWDTKRFQNGPYASGAVVHVEDRDLVNKFIYMDTTVLAKFGTIAEEIAVYRNALKTSKSMDEKKKLMDLIKSRKEDVKIEWKKIEAKGDLHLGAPDAIGKYSKDQLIRACQIYQREHGLPDIASWDEIGHGTMERTFSSPARYLGLVPEKFRQAVIEPILADKTINPEQRAYKISEKAMENLRAITIHNTSDQQRLFALLMKPYGQELVDAGKTLILCSGNHANKSERNSDEANALANQFDEKYRDNGQVRAFEGKGNDFGLGWMKLPGTNPAQSRKMFVMHGFPRNQDEGYGIMHHMRKMNNDADIVLAGDLHQPIVLFADGRAGALHPGMEPINAFCPRVGLPAGVRGMINVMYDPKNRGIYGFELVLNPTLERYIKKHKIM
ncbi:MAG: hypothetical protein WCK90_00590 [archaeon]